jgi:dephospho-CoA kinase
MEPKQLKTVAVVGHISPAKEELVDYLRQRHGVTTMAVGEIAREFAARTGDEPPTDAPSGHNVSEKRLAQLGPEHFMRRVIEAIEENKWNWDTLAVTGIESAATAQALKEHFGSDFILVHVRDGTEKDDAQMNQISGQADVTLEKTRSREAFHKQIETQIVPHLRYEAA